MGEVPLAAVIGHPVSHSLSPEIFEFIARRTGQPVIYRRLDLAPDQLGPMLKVARQSGLFSGWNVTIPHKQTLARKADSLSPEAKLIGAVNVACFRRGRIEGHNTDAQGVIGTLAERRVPLRGAQTILIGAGGAAMAAAFALGRARAGEVLIFNRTQARARALAQRMGRLYPRTRFTAHSLAESVSLDVSRAVVCINATPLGMKGFPAPRAVIPRSLGRRALAFDMVYRPLVTPFLREARARGLKTVGGLDMLVWQALGTWEIWFGRIPGGARGKFAIKRALKRRLEKKLEGA